jgi:PII-like signaling protein
MMQIDDNAKLLRILIGESDVFRHIPVYELIVQEARKSGLAGATVFKGIMGFGGSSLIHTAKILRLSEDLALIIEIVDEESKIEAFIPAVEALFEAAHCGGLITIEKAEIIKYVAMKK